MGGVLYGYSTNSRTYRVYKPSTRRVIESRNVTFLETPPRNLGSITDTEETYDTYLFDVLNFTSTFSNNQFNMDKDESTSRIQNILHHDQHAVATQSGVGPSSGEGTQSGVVPTAGPASPGIVSSTPQSNQSGVVPSTAPVASSSSAPQVTRASTRSRPTGEVIDPSSLTASQLRSIKGLGNFIAPKLDFAHDSESPTALAFAYITDNPTASGLAGEDGDRIKIPDTYAKAKASPQASLRGAATDKEMNSLDEHEVFDLVPATTISRGEKAIGSRYVFKQKANGAYKARLVVQGYYQRPGIDFGQTFAPVCRIGSQRMILAIACEHEWPVYQLDVQVAFLQSKIDGDVYVKTAPGRARTTRTGHPW